MDAAILFSDIVLPLVVAGVDIEIKPGVGPVVATPVRSVADVDALPPLEPDAARLPDDRRPPAGAPSSGRRR